MTKARKPSSEGPKAKGPGPDAAATANQDQAPHNEPSVPEGGETDKVPDELAVAFTELAKLDSVLAGGQAVAVWLDRVLRPHLEAEAPGLERDDIAQVVDAIGAVQAGLDTAREHVQTIKAEIGLLQGRFVGAPSRTVSLASIMGRLASLDDLALDIVARLIGHLSARARSAV